MDDRHHRTPHPQKARSTAAPCSTCIHAAWWGGRSTRSDRRLGHRRASHGDYQRPPGPGPLSIPTTAANSRLGCSVSASEAWIDASMGKVGGCRQRPDGVVLGAMQTELLDRQKWKTRPQLANGCSSTSRSSTTGSAATARRLPHAQRIRDGTLNTHPAGHFVLTSGPPNGVKD